LPRPFRSANCPEAHQPILQELIPRGFRKVFADISRQLLDLFNPNHQSPISAFNTKPRIVLGKGYSCTRYVWPSVSQSPWTSAPCSPLLAAIGSPVSSVVRSRAS